MSSATLRSDHPADEFGAFGPSRVGIVCKQILNGLAALANRPAERRRLALLPTRYLEDIGMTIAERDDYLR